MTEITFLTKQEIDRRRVELLDKAGMSLADLQARAALYQLSPEQEALLAELRDLEFLASA